MSSKTILKYFLQYFECFQDFIEVYFYIDKYSFVYLYFQQLFIKKDGIYSKKNYIKQWKKNIC